MATEPGSSKSRFEEFGRKIDERVGDAIPRVEEEVKKVITYLNDEVVPQVRQNSSQALRGRCRAFGAARGTSGQETIRLPRYR